MSSKYSMSKSGVMSQSKSDREKQKLITDKCQSLIEVLLKEDDNKYCVDCDAKGPRWASWNIGVFLCIRCAGIHRNLGVHISRVKSVNLDAWTPDHVAHVQRMGNKKARQIYEANLPDDFRRPQTDTALESFIRAKYELRKYIATNYTDPGPPQPAFSVEEELKRMKEMKRNKGNSSTNITKMVPLASDAKTISKVKEPSPTRLKKPTGLGTGLVDIETIASAVEETNAANGSVNSQKFSLSQLTETQPNAIDLLTGDLSAAFISNQDLIDTKTISTTTKNIPPENKPFDPINESANNLLGSTLGGSIQPLTVSKPQAAVGKSVLDLDFEYNQSQPANQAVLQNQPKPSPSTNNVLSKEYILSLYSSPSSLDNNPLNFGTTPTVTGTRPNSNNLTGFHMGRQ